MNEHTTSGAAVGAVLYKLLPAGLGAAIMICVDPPDSRRELFARLFCAFAMSYLFGDVALTLLQQVTWFAFLDSSNRAHTNAVDGLVGACGWFVAGAASVLLKRFKRRPLKTIKDVRGSIGGG